MQVTINQSDISLSEYLKNSFIYSLTLPPVFLIFVVNIFDFSMEEMIFKAYLPSLLGISSVFFGVWLKHSKKGLLEYRGNWYYKQKLIKNFGWAGVLVSYFTIQPILFLAIGVLTATFAVELSFPFRRSKNLNTFDIKKLE
jgi:hypothetical protein